MKRKLIVAVIAICANLLLIGGVFAFSGKRDISALLNGDLKIIFNGEEQVLKNANGERVYPISYEGTTYLPVRAVANLVKLPVSYNQEKYAVELGSKVEYTNLVDLKHERATKYNYIINDDSLLSFRAKGSTDAKRYNNGLIFNMLTGAFSDSEYTRCYFDVDGFSDLKFTIAAKKNFANVVVYDENSSLIATFDVEEGNVIEKEIRIKGAKKIAIVANTKQSQQGQMMIYEPMVK